MRTLLAYLVVLLASSAPAYESKCYVGSAACAPGAGTAQNRWVGFLDEHRQIWNATLGDALPPAALAAFDLRLYTDGTTTTGGLPSMQPTDFRLAKRALDRPGPRTIAEFTQLPDFSYSLWDWALGHETCPLDASIDATACHTFETHLGPTNSSHFPPQSREFYRHYHALAVRRAQECDTLARRLVTARGRFLHYLVACEQEALVLEAIGQHYLQDAWSMGHMWERWGSPEPADVLADLNGARVVGALSGLIHGARGAMQGLIPNADVNDPMCAPAADVAWRLPAPGSPLMPAIGDDYWTLVQTDYPTQFTALTQCAAAGVAGVLSEFSDPALGGTSLPPSLDPVASCFEQRATNRSMLRGAALEFIASGVPTRIAFDAVGVTALPHFVEGNDAPKITAAQRLDMVRVAVRIGNLTAQDPDGVQLASGGMPPLIGFERNAAYADRQPIASYVDPPLPWPARTGGEPRALALARLFHRAHAADWCEIMSSDYLRGLKYHVTEAASRDPLERATAMEVCTEFVKRHVRGRNDKGAALTDEPLCRLAASAPDSVAVVNTMTSVATPTDESVAQAWCACGNGTLEAGEECDASAPSGDTACPGACRAPNHTRTIGALEVYDDCRCGEVCDDDVDNDGDDDVDCTDDDCKNDPACAPTRIYFSTCSSFARAGQATIRSMNADGSDLKQVGVGGAEVRVSPDGARLASVTSATTVSTSRLDGSDRHDITVQGQIEVFGGLAWSPPGDSIVIAVMGRNREDTAPERQLQTSPDRTGTTDGIWHLGPTLGTRVDWVAGNWLFNYSYNGASGYLNGAASAPAFSESRVAVFNPYSEPVFGLVGNVRYRPDGTPSWSGVLGGTTGLIVDGVLWLGTDAFGIPAYSPDGLWVAAAYTGGIAVFAFDGSSAYNAYFGSSICGLDWGRGVPPVPAGP